MDVQKIIAHIDGLINSTKRREIYIDVLDEEPNENILVYYKNKGFFIRFANGILSVYYKMVEHL